MMKTHFHAYLAVLGLVIAGCDSEPADVAGQYTISVTNGDNGCNFENWTVGEQSTGIPVNITQEEASVTAEVQGLTGILLDFLLGTNVYTGSVDGNSLELSIYGTNSASQGDCTYTVNSFLDAEVDGDVLTGEIRYQAATVDNPACAELAGCASIQNFNGTRPPQ